MLLMGNGKLELAVTGVDWSGGIFHQMNYIINIAVQPVTDSDIVPIHWQQKHKSHSGTRGAESWCPEGDTPVHVLHRFTQQQKISLKYLMTYNLS